MRELISVESTYWWHVAKRELVIELLRKHFPPPGLLVEGGIGGGANLAAFREMGYRVRGFDLSRESVDHCRSVGLEDVHVLDLQRPWPVEPGTARAVVLLDVIEHVPEPARVLAHAAQALAPGAGIVFTVPANESLMGPWDAMLGHYRRYSPRMLREQAAAAGLKVAWMSHWNAFTLPVAIAIRGSERLGRKGLATEFPKVPAGVNSLLIHLARAERAAMHRRPVPAGLSLVGVLGR